MIYRTATTADGEEITLTSKGGPGAHLFEHGPGVGAFTGRGPLRGILLGLGCRAWQTGDVEFTVTFPESLRAAVYEATGARRTKKGVTPEHLRKFHFRPGVGGNGEAQIQEISGNSTKGGGETLVPENGPRRSIETRGDVFRKELTGAAK